MSTKKKALSENWKFRQTTTLNNKTAKELLPVSQFPTVAHIDLLHHGLIKDPYLDANELESLWVNDADWEYVTSFWQPEFDESDFKAELVCEGLDTICTVVLNGTTILEARNMHIEHRVDVTTCLSPGPNTLELKFKNAPAFAKAEMKRIGYKGNGTDVHFGGPERLFVRKAQYHWGWDWGPALNTCGPWKPIWLQTWDGAHKTGDGTRITDLKIRQHFSDDLKSVKLQVIAKVECENPSPERAILVLIKNPGGGQVGGTVSLSPDSADTFSTEIEIRYPELWFPFTYGEQPLYEVICSSPFNDSKGFKFGIRRLRLLQHPLKKEPGTSFTFEINNVRIFAGGACWIPCDYLLPRVTEKRLRDWLTLAKSGNQAMIRVWGGGLVESDDFYNICDELGILVWQDFLFACGDYPASADFVAQIKAEAEQQVRRVGHHACLAIWAGNNEDYMLAEKWGWEYDMKDENEENWAKSNFPSRLIYEKVLPDVCERLAGDVPYWRSSPYGGSTSNDTTVGDTHIWDVWHGKMSPYQSYKTYTSRFVSEFGFESAPSLRVLHLAITQPSERHWQSLSFDAHDKGPGHQRRYPMYSGENFRFQFNPLSSFVYCSQFLQAEAMSYAYNHWRREFRGEGEENCSGILVWQLNDIWPGTSWALVDSEGGRKPSFFITKRALAKVVVGMERVLTEQDGNYMTGYSYPEKREKMEVWGVNGHLTNLKVTLKIKAFDIGSGEEVVIPDFETEREVVLKANQSTELAAFKIPKAETTVIAAYLDDTSTNTRLARWISWPEPLKFVKFSPSLKVTHELTRREGNEIVVLKSNAPVKGVVVQVPIEDGGKDAALEDNFVDLVPGEEVEIWVGEGGLGGRGVETRFLCDWEYKEGFVL
ncbi:glycoside hydrolase family 2 protein [Amylocarpus encephaloides]|uniref:Beta-mannosidase B n=1 Tax=Amylocarpus encephaloides TaxID=45428 RepID=A0A9P7YBK3_9HELO|nr:glycoside hydrolase family 2 protein [Amylocarpus encephaloides]